MIIEKYFIDENAPLFSLLERVDYSDAYSCCFQTHKPLKVEEVVLAFFKSAPEWLHKLFDIRDRMVSGLGIKTVNRKERDRLLREFKVEPGQALGLFTVIQKTRNEVIMGENDKHLNFRVAVQLHQQESESGKSEIVFMTAVQVHNRLGRYYFMLIKPFHHLVVKVMLRNTVKYLLKKEQTKHSDQV
jgi:hypothetical protein